MSDTLKSWIFVIIQALLLGLLIFIPSSAAPAIPALGLTGKAVEIIGGVILLISLYDLRKSLTALPLPKAHGILQVRGLYKYVRHPMYVGVLILSLGIAISSGLVLKYLLVLGLWILFSFKARYEETLLLAKYPGYNQYMTKVPRFVPRLVRNSTSRNSQ